VPAVARCLLKAVKMKWKCKTKWNFTSEKYATLITHRKIFHPNCVWQRRVVYCPTSIECHEPVSEHYNGSTVQKCMFRLLVSIRLHMIDSWVYNSSFPKNDTISTIQLFAQTMSKFLSDEEMLEATKPRRSKSLIGFCLHLCCCLETGPQGELRHRV